MCVCVRAGEGGKRGSRGSLRRHADWRKGGMSNRQICAKINKEINHCVSAHLHSSSENSTEEKRCMLSSGGVLNTTAADSTHRRSVATRQQEV